MSAASESSINLLFQAKRAVYHLQEIRGYRYISYIDRGSYGVVVNMYDDHNKQSLAIKCTPEPSELELKKWPKLKHQNIIPLLETVNLDECTVFIMPFMWADLWTHTGDEAFYEDLLSFDHCRMWLRDTVRGLAYLHRKGLCHQDLKLDNIFLKQNGHACLGDFSLMDYIENITDESPFLEHYRPPESTSWYLENFGVPKENLEISGDAVDMWQVGILSVELLSNGKVTNRKLSDYPRWRYDIYPFVLKVLYVEEYLKYLLESAFTTRHFSSEEIELFHDFLSRLFSFKDEKRMTADEAKYHMFVDIKWPQMGPPQETPVLTLEEDVLASVSKLYHECESGQHQEEKPVTSSASCPPNPESQSFTKVLIPELPAISEGTAETSSPPAATPTNEIDKSTRRTNFNNKGETSPEVENTSNSEPGPSSRHSNNDLTKTKSVQDKGENHLLPVELVETDGENSLLNESGYVAVPAQDLKASVPQHPQDGADHVILGTKQEETAKKLKKKKKR